MQEQLNLARYLASFRTLFIPSRARNNVPQRMKKTLPDLECLSIPPVLNLAPVLHAIEITTPERHKIAAPGTRLRLAAFAVHAQRARIRISLRRVVTV